MKIKLKENASEVTYVSERNGFNLDETQTLVEERYCSKRKETIFLKVRRMKVFQLV